MARTTGRSGFKMKSSPTKGLSNFFSSLGAKKTGDIGKKLKSKYSGKAQRADKVARPGESEYQFKVRTRKARAKAKKADKPYDIKSSSIFEPTKFGHEGKSFFSPTTSDLDRKLIMADTARRKLDLKSDVFDLSTKTPKAPTAQEMINTAYKGTKNNWGKASKNAMDMFGVTLTELISKRDSPVEKKSLYKKGIGKYAEKAKGSRGYKMKKN